MTCVFTCSHLSVLAVVHITDGVLRKFNSLVLSRSSGNNVNASHHCEENALISSEAWKSTLNVSLIQKEKLQCPNCRVQMSQKVIKWGLQGPYEIETLLSQQAVPINESYHQDLDFQAQDGDKCL